MERMSEANRIKKCIIMNVEEKRAGGRPRKTWGEDSVGQPKK